jgi:hypothetical protein
MLFVFDNIHYFQNNSSVHENNTRYKNQLTLPSVRLSAIQRGTTCSPIKLFNKLPPGIWELKNDKVVFKPALKKYLLTHAFYSVEEFLTNDELLFIFGRVLFFISWLSPVVLLYWLFFNRYIHVFYP